MQKLTKLNAYGDISYSEQERAGGGGGKGGGTY